MNHSNSSHSVRINGLIDDDDIAESFATSFKDVYKLTDPVQASCLKDRFSRMHREYSLNHTDDDISMYYLNWSDMTTIVSKLKTGKSSGTFVKSEHILNGSPKLIVHLQLLFNSMLQHSYVPTEFLSGVISPLIKDAEGDHGCTSNYRGLTLSVVFAFLFEHALLLKIGNLLQSDSLQFGYKKRHSTTDYYLYYGPVLNTLFFL